jgi:hypothetical protein
MITERRKLIVFDDGKNCAKQYTYKITMENSIPQLLSVFRVHNECQQKKT